MKKTRSLPPIVAAIPDWLAPRFLGALILVACLAATYATWRGASDDVEQRVRADFDFRERELSVGISSRMQTYLQVLYGVQGLYASSVFVDRAEFHNYVTMQRIDQHFPGIDGVGFMRLVPRAGREAHIAALRREGFPQYIIMPDGERASYAPIVYLEPFKDSNLRAFGFDPYSNAIRAEAMDRARDSGLPAMTAKIHLVQEQGRELKQAGFLIVLPVYDNQLPHATLGERRGAIRGWVYAPFRMGDLMAGLGGEQGKLLDLKIYDGEEIAPAALMYDGDAGAAGGARPAILEKISIAGRRWTLAIGAVQGFDRAEADKPRLIAWGGLLLSLGLAGLTWLLARSRVLAQTALARADALTRQLNLGQAALLTLAVTAQRDGAVLRSILDSTVDGILVDKLDGQVLNANRRLRELWRVPEALDWQSDGAALFVHIELQLNQAAPFLHGRERAPRAREERRDLLHLKDGRVFEQFTRAVQLDSGSARLWSFRDITERSQAEQRERSRRQVLELLATDASLSSVLDSVVLGVEAAHPLMLCSVLLLDAEGKHLLVGAAPSLPAFYNAAVHGLAVDGAPGSCGEAVRSGLRVIAEDLATDPRWQFCRDISVRAGLGACWSEPIRGVSGRVLGSFAIYHRQPRRPDGASLALIEEASRLAGIAVEQAQAGVALRAGEARFRSLYDHAPVALWEQDWSAVRAALGQPPFSGVDDLAGFLLAHPEQTRRLAALVRILDVNAAALAQVGAPGLDKSGVALGLAQNFNDDAMPAFSRAVVALAGGAHLFACESAFLRLDGVARQNELTLLVMPGHEQSLNFVIVSTLDITERKRMNDDLLLLATTDFLTGLPNRRQFMQQLDAEHARLLRELGGCAAVLMLDLDHFKAINDEHGHAVGDAVLRHVAALMLAARRKVDSLGRVGGEEFAILLPGTGMAAAAVFAERLRQRIADTPLAQDGDAAPVTVTVSIGIAVMAGTEAGYEAVLIRADKALYGAKRSGRNRIGLRGHNPARAGQREA